MLNEHVAPAVFCMCSKKNGSVCEEKKCCSAWHRCAGSEQQSVLGNIIQP